MTFVHIADVHFGNCFSIFQGKSNLVNQRLFAQKKAFEKIIEYIKSNHIEHFFISGDLFEQDIFNTSIGIQYVEYCNNKFKEIPNTKIWISPGNHDPYIKNSYYQTFSWSNNVTIFKNILEFYPLDDVNIYGFGFGDFYESNSPIDNITIENKNKLNVLITHADLDGNKNGIKLYQPLSSKVLIEKGFDYVALGHIHKTNFSKESRIIYPGSTIALSFDSISENHGFVSGNITKDYYNLEFITLDSDFYLEECIDISDLTDIYHLEQEIKNIYYNSDSVYQIKLIGKRKFYINTDNLLKSLNIENIIKLKDETSNNYDYEKISNEENLRGYFVKELLNRLENANNEEKEKIQIALDVGLNLLE